ncbi:MAG TPA: glutamine amidotransferase [Polyangiaceae bacterium]|nr:glutamine amidotransferase [Polyangiaceae bacterium]
MVRPNKIVVVITGDPVSSVEEQRGDYAAMMRAAIGDAWTGSYAAVDARTESLGAELDGAAIVITGSSSNVHHREDWMLRAEARLRELEASEAPILGICFGHQLMAQAYGGDVQPNPKGREVSTVMVEQLAADPLFEGIGPRFAANACHSDSVVALPDGARVLGRSEGDPHQVLRFGQRSWGVQFHPEFDGDVMRRFIEARSEAILGEGLDLTSLERAARDTPDARAVFRNFVRHVMGD